MTGVPALDLSFIIHGGASNPDAGAPSGAEFAWPGAACTASTYTVYPMFFPGWQVRFARWICAWNPMTPAESPAVVRLVTADDGPVVTAELARFARTYCTNPMDDGVDITEALQAAWASGKPRFHIGHQTAGDGQDSPLIYQSRVELYLTPEHG